MITACSACNAQFDAGSYRDPACPACGAIAPTRPHSCPVCDVPFERRAVHDLTIERCRSCDGAFLDASTIERMAADPSVERCNALLAALLADPTAKTRRGEALRCPICNDVMQRKLSESGAGVVIDFCYKHGTFFDAAELPRIITFARREAQRAEREGFAAGARPAIVVPLREPAPPSGPHADKMPKPEETNLLRELGDLLVQILEGR